MPTFLHFVLSFISDKTTFSYCSLFGSQATSGLIVHFWIKICNYQLQKADQKIEGFPVWLKAPLDQIVTGSDYLCLLGRSVLGQYLAFIARIDIDWFKVKLMPKLEFERFHEEAFVLWQPHVVYGQLSRELILLMQQSYREAFPYFKNVQSGMERGFLRHIAAIVHSCLFDINETNWFVDFFQGLSENQRVSWARDMDFILQQSSATQNSLMWHTWMKNYWNNRLEGVPCGLAVQEAEIFFGWAFASGIPFEEASELIIRSKPTQLELQRIESKIGKTNIAERHPLAVLKLLQWLLQGSGWVPENIDRLILGLPRKKAYVPELEKICQRLALRAYPKSQALLTSIKEEFIQDD